MTSGCTEVNQTTSSATGIQRQEQLLEKCVTHATDTATLLSDGAKTAQPGILEPTTAETKDNEPEPTLTPAVQYVLKNRQRRQARAQVQAKSSTACFALGTPILVKKVEKASWIPMYLAEKGDIVVQTLPSAKIALHQTRLARQHPLVEGHEQAGPAPTLEQGTEPGQLPKYHQKNTLAIQ